MPSWKSQEVRSVWRACIARAGRGRPGTPSQYSDIGDIFSEENSALTPPRCSTLSRHMLVPFVPARPREHLLAAPPTALFSVYSPARLFISRLDATWTPFAKGTIGAWSILLMVRTRVVADSDPRRSHHYGTKTWTRLADGQIYASTLAGRRRGNF